MYDRTLRTYPIGNKIRGTTLYYNNFTGIKDWSSCRSCILCNGRRRVCIRRDGIRTWPNSTRCIKLFFIGEAPGATEDATGIPFSGRSGRILNQIFEYTQASFEFCITNLVCCRPVDIKILMPEGIDSEENLSQLVPIYEYSNHNRKPNPTEIIACQPHIHEIVSTFKPRGIVYLGQVASNSFLPIRTISSLSLLHPATIVKEEYKVITMRKQAKKLTTFIKEILGEKLC